MQLCKKISQKRAILIPVLGANALADVHRVFECAVHKVLLHFLPTSVCIVPVCIESSPCLLNEIEFSASSDVNLESMSVSRSDVHNSVLFWGGCIFLPGHPSGQAIL